MTRDLFTVVRAQRDSTTVARFRGELDLAGRADLEEALQALLDGDAELVELDLTELTFLDASSLYRIVEFGERLRAQGRELVLNNPSPLVRRLLGFADVRRVAELRERRSPRWTDTS
jgi:anti-anti-sigma factor